MRSLVAVCGGVIDTGTSVILLGAATFSRLLCVDGTLGIFKESGAGRPSLFGCASGRASDDLPPS